MRLILLASGATLALTLAACNQAAPPPAADATPVAPPTPAESAPAPAASALPSAPPARVSWAPPARRYHYLDEAYQESSAYADAPPDYAFDYDNNAPEAWGGGDGIVRVGERVPGGWRYYYYQPGSDQPYLVRDPEYAYGFDGGVLTVVYDSHGRALDEATAQRQADLAGRYYFRAQALRRAAMANQRHEVAETVWRDQRAEQDRQRQVWTQARQSDPDWRNYSQTAPQPQWGAVAAAWAARQPAPSSNGGPPSTGTVAAARDAWRARVAPAAAPAPASPVAPVGAPEHRGPDLGAPDQRGPDQRGPGGGHDRAPMNGRAPAAGPVEGGPRHPAPPLTETPGRPEPTTGGAPVREHLGGHPSGGAPAASAPPPPVHAHDVKPAVVTHPAAPAAVHPAPAARTAPPAHPAGKPTPEDEKTKHHPESPQ